MRIGGYLIRLWKLTDGWRLPIAGNALCGTLHVAASLLFIWASKYLVDMATGQAKGSFVGCASIMVACVVAQLFFSAASKRIESLTGIAASNALRHELFDRLMRSRLAGREGRHTGDMVNRLEEDVDTVADLLCRVIPAVWVTLVRLLAALGFLLLMDRRLALILLLIMPIALSLSKRYVRRMRTLTREIREMDGRVQAHLQENLQHRTLVVALERGDRASEALGALQDGLYRRVRRKTDFSLFSRVMVQGGFAAGFTLAFLWGVAGLWQGTMTFGMVTTFLQLAGQVQRPVVELGNQLPAFVRAFVAVERLDELAAAAEEERGAPIRIGDPPGMRLEGISFTYPGDDSPVVKALSYDFAPGSLTAVVGETGAGKSTLARLMLALSLPDEGRITLYDGGREVEVSPRTRCNIRYVPQGNSLLTGTIRDNLLLGNPDASDEEMRHALHLAVADFVHELPAGMDTLCGELGAGLSEGQAQRIAIARGLLRPGGILLLDEPTSALDSETERLLMARLAELSRDKTLIVITHKMETARFCGSVLRLPAR